MSDFRVVDGCPVNSTIAPYIELLRQETGATINSLYRGQDAAAILHRHGKHTQAELFRTLPAGTANPPGRSSHELRSDGVCYAGPVGRHLAWWQQGIDLDDAHVDRFIQAARRHGWVFFRPYPSGVEHHHVNARYTLKPHSVKDRARLIWLRARLPRR